MPDIAPIRPLDEATALEWLRRQPGKRTNLPVAELGRRWGWHRQRASRRLKAWQKACLVTRGDNVITVADSPPKATIDMAAYVAAIFLAGAAGFFSIKGMVVLFPGASLAVVVMAFAMEAAKLVTARWLARQWRVTAPVWRLALAVLVAGLVLINATGVYAKLVAAHVGERGPATSIIEMEDAALAARIEVAAHTVADLDRRLSQIDSTIEEAASAAGPRPHSRHRGSAQKREVLAAQRQSEGKPLADLKAERAVLGAKGRQICGRGPQGRAVAGRRPRRKVVARRREGAHRRPLISKFPRLRRRRPRLPSDHRGRYARSRRRSVRYAAPDPAPQRLVLATE